MLLSMKDNRTKETTVTAIRTIHRLGLCLTAALLTLACMPASAWDDRDRSDDYKQVNLVSDVPGVALSNSHYGPHGPAG